MGHFHTRSLENGLRFPLPNFIRDTLIEYDVVPSQLVPNTWRILCAFYLGCKKKGITPTVRHLKRFYYLKSREEFYFFQARDHKIVTGLLDSSKGWKRLFNCMTNSIGFGVCLSWRVANADRNQALEILPDEEENYNKLLGLELFWQLVLNKEKLGRYWLSVSAPNAGPSTATPNYPILQIGELDRVVFPFVSLWFSFLVVIDYLPF